MRILTWAPLSYSGRSAFWRWLEQGMSSQGHQVIALDSLALLSLYGLRGMQRALLAFARAYRIQAALVLPTNLAEPWLLDALGDMGVVRVGLRFDDGIMTSRDDWQPNHHVRRYLCLHDPHCDLAVTIARKAPERFRAWGLPVPTFLPLPLTVLAPPPPGRVDRVVRYAGTPRYDAGAPTSFRVQVLRGLVEAGLPVEVLHDEWRQVPGFADVVRSTPTPEGLDRLLATAGVNVVIGTEWEAQPAPLFKQLSLEVAAAGGMQITSPSAELAEVLAEGDDYVTATSVEEFVRLAAHWLEHPEAALAMGGRARNSLLARRGWHGWWERVGAILAERGISLPLDGEPVPPAAAETTALAMIASGLAHAHEAADDPIAARRWFSFLCHLDPRDYDGLAGLARLAETGEARRQYWQAAGEVVEPTHPLMTPGYFQSRAIGAAGTVFRLEAGKQWLEAAFATGGHDDVLAAARIIGPLDEHLHLGIVRRLLDAGAVDAAARCLAHGRETWPDGPAWQALARLVARLRQG